MDSLAFWFRRKYLLAPTDPRFLNATADQIAADYWAWQYIENPNSLKEVVDDEFDLSAEIAAADAEVDDFEDI